MNSYKQHLQSKKHKEATKIRAAPRAAVAPDAADLSFPSSTYSGPSAPRATDGSGGGAPVSTAAVAGAASISGGVFEVGAAAMSSAPNGPLKAGVEVQLEAEEEKIKEEEEGQEGGEEELAPPRMGPGVCIFCNVELASFEDNCQHMLHKHG